MKFEKTTLDSITRCYCASSITIDNKLHLLFASEDPNSPCYSYPIDDLSSKEIVWDDRGGCMSIIPIPNTNGEFLAVNEFYLKVSPSLSKLVWGKYTEKGWVIKDILNLPYLHRFDIYHKNGVNYLIAATIAESKENKEDWSKAGKIYTAVLPNSLEEEIKLEELCGGMYRNHGYYRSTYKGEICGYFTSDQGIIRVTPPSSIDGEWGVEKILDGMISEIAVIDIDNDGQDELITIEPFHGNTIKIYKLEDSKYVEVYKYPHELDFAHALVGAKLNGVNSFVGGIRRVNAELFVIQYVDDKFKLNIVETGVGPANIHVVNNNGIDYILSANHTNNEAAIYKVED